MSRKYLFKMEKFTSLYIEDVDLMEVAKIW